MTAPAPVPPIRELALEFSGPVAAAIHAVAVGRVDQLAIFGPRGEGKTTAALAAMLMHAQVHASGCARCRGPASPERPQGRTRTRDQALVEAWPELFAPHPDEPDETCPQGFQPFALPTRWIGVTDTFESHRTKTLESLRSPIWQGAWHVTEGGHVATFRAGGRAWVRLRLIGVDTPRDEDRIRAECHGIWFEEAAPATDQSMGLSERAWEIGLTSRRLPTHAPVALLTENAPDEAHWTWQRFYVRPRPGTGYIRIPKGTRTTPEQRAAWAATITDPALRARLLEGEPGTVLLGEAVAVGYNSEAHVSRHPLPVAPHVPLWFGWDSATNARTHATVIAQLAGRQIRILAGLVSEASGLKQHLETVVLPWLARHAPWALEEGGDDRLFHRYDPAMAALSGEDVDQSPLLRVQETLGGHFAPGPVAWPARIGPLLAVFQESADGAPALVIAPGEDTALLRRALGGRWDYPKSAAGQVTRDLPRKPNHPWEDLGDALCYLVGALRPQRTLTPSRPRPPRRYGRLLGALP
ncbi:MAG TPA: hypothetical protein VNP94_02735 [Actinomycetota bacterium]|nr:hypothetical protein [Actinomycetota bacterium]